MGLLLPWEASTASGFVGQGRATALKNSISMFTAWLNGELAWEVCGDSAAVSTTTAFRCFPFFWHLLQKQANKTPVGEPVMSLMGWAGKCLVTSNAKLQFFNLFLIWANQLYSFHPSLAGGIMLLILLWLASWLLFCPLLNAYVDLRTPETSSQWGRAVRTQELCGNYFCCTQNRVGL